MSSDFHDSEISNHEPVVAALVTEASAESGSNAAADSETLSYLHPMSLLFELVSQIRSYLVPAALGLFGAAKGDLVFIIISAVIFVPAFLTCIVRYFTYRYCIKDDHLVVRQGLVFKSVRTIPVDRIQNIDFVQNPLHRVFQVAEVKIETASGTKPEATMRVLSMEQMAKLRSSVFDKKASATLDQPSTVAAHELDAAGLGSAGYGVPGVGSVAGVESGPVGAEAAMVDSHPKPRRF